MMRMMRARDQKFAFDCLEPDVLDIQSFSTVPTKTLHCRLARLQLHHYRSTPQPVGSSLYFFDDDETRPPLLFLCCLILQD